MFFFLSGAGQHSLPVCHPARQAIFHEDHPFPIINTPIQQQKFVDRVKECGLFGQRKPSPLGRVKFQLLRRYKVQGTRYKAQGDDKFSSIFLLVPCALYPVPSPRGSSKSRPGFFTLPFWMESYYFLIKRY
jgi:hypothetical protein